MRDTIDYLGSLFAAGVVMTMLMGFQVNLGETASSQVFTNVVQEQLTSLTEILEYDLRKVGYRWTAGPAVIFVDSIRLAFRTDIDNDGSPDSILYRLRTTPAPVSSDPPTRVLERSVNGGPALSCNVGLTSLRFAAHTATGTQTTNPADIRSLTVALALESPLASGDQFPGVFWERTFTPQNMR